MWKALKIRTWLLAAAAAAVLPGGVSAEPLDAQEKILGIPGDLAHAAWNLVSTRTALRDFAVGGGATALSSVWDDDMREWVQDDHPFESFESIGNDVLGDSAYLGGAALLMSAGGLVFQDSRLFDTGLAAVEGLLLDLVLVDSLKALVGRNRPDDSGDKSFPSGHVTGITSLVVTFAEMYDLHWGYRAALYTLPVITAASRMETDDHHLSDTVAGMTLGTMVAHAVVARWQDRESAALVAPVLLDDGAGLKLAVSF